MVTHDACDRAEASHNGLCICNIEVIVIPAGPERTQVLGELSALFPYIVLELCVYVFIYHGINVGYSHVTS